MASDEMTPSAFRGRAPAPSSATAAASIDVAGYFEAAREAALKAEQQAGDSGDYHYRIGPHGLRLRFATGSSVSHGLTAAFAHLEEDQPADPPALTVRIWDTDSTGVSLPPPPWERTEYRQCGEIRRFINDRFYTHFDGGFNALSMIDFERNEALYWMRSSHYIPYYEKAAPLRAILQAWMSRHGLHHVHAAGVGLEHGGVLLVGAKGAGKSNTALACLNSPLRYAGDDHCLLGAEPSPWVHSIYNSGKTYHRDIERLPFLRPLVANAEFEGDEKALYFLHRHYPERLINGFPLKAILLPHVTRGRETALSPASAAEGLRIIAPDAMLKWPSVGRRTFETITAVFRRIPCYRLEVGSDVSRIPERILGLLESD